ncbi:radical SAM family heme chaperone HemW [Jannaschia aquimarina]|uniref:Heme chaperone HemW n=1 Tax=Jannaschia aquimarina TaxID=935700 RepID=A0A0D1CJR7_9RHOB|nr:radical SAM family heme chaperone HemW [Jannaschia aquimarina]KIT14972.1 Oxygen-independent coproporphyrinogen-III oxidase 1 [Jannaschia aquimarina]SNS60883.1 oxygen-independent coproporphyrinogen-3 oxidase [Jannaschia aquimarina]
MSGFGLYIHWPFCEAKCPYCDFNSHVSASVDHAAWREALLTDLRSQAVEMPDRILGSIFFGGGTPSRMEPETVAALVDEARRIWPCANDLEVTLEANPTSVEAGRFAAFAAGGVNRVSIGIQSLRDDDLRALGRTHDSAQARAAYDIARATFDRVSFDLIYARQGQDLEAWRSELTEAVAMDPDHLSIYQLTIEPGTVFARRHEAGKLPGLPDDDKQADMYLFSNSFLESRGRPAYEVSNHARPGLESRHNLTYWRAEDWLGVGPGAHGRYGTGHQRLSTIAERQPATWLAAVSDRGRGEARRETADGHAEEYLIGAMRLREGVDLRRLRELGATVPEEMCEPLVEDGLITLDNERLRPTTRGMAVADALISYLAVRSVPKPESISQI